MPRTTYNSKHQAFGLAPKPQPTPAPIIHQHQQQAPGLMGSIVQGFGLGMGSSIAHNIFENRPAPVVVQHQTLPQTQTQTRTQPQVIDYKTIEFKQCMEKKYNNYDECVHHLE